MRAKREEAQAVRDTSRENEWLAAKIKQDAIQRNRVSRDTVRSKQRDLAAQKLKYKVS